MLRKKIKLLIKNILLIEGLVTLLSTYFIFIWTWFVAFFQSSKSVTVTVNKYGEAFPELILILIVTPIIIYTFYELADLLWSRIIFIKNMNMRRDVMQ